MILDRSTCGQMRSAARALLLALLLGSPLPLAASESGGTLCSRLPTVCDGTYTDASGDMYPRLSLCARARLSPGAPRARRRVLPQATAGHRAQRHHPDRDRPPDEARKFIVRCGTVE